MKKPVYLAEVEQLTLLALVRLRKQAYGAAIWREIEDRAKRQILGATVYSTLKALESKGYIVAKWGDATPVQGGRAKKYYEITDEGFDALTRSMQAVNEMQKGLKFGLSAKQPAQS